MRGEKKLSDSILANQLWSRSLQDSFDAHESNISSLEDLRTFDLVKKNINNWTSKINQTLAGSSFFPIGLVKDHQEMTDTEFIEILMGKMKTLNAIYDSTLLPDFRYLPASFICNLSFIEISLSNILNACLSISTLNVISIEINCKTTNGNHYLSINLKDDHNVLESLAQEVLDSSEAVGSEITVKPKLSTKSALTLTFPITNPKAKIIAVNER